MRIAVTTPNGHVGHHLTRALVRAGLRPLLLMRQPDRLDPELTEYVDVAQADSRDKDQVSAATVGVDALYWVDPSPESDKPLADYTLATGAVVSAVLKNNIPRVVFQSSVGAEKRHGAGEIDGLAATEMALDTLNVDVTHLRCGYFFINLLFQADAVRAGLLQVVVPLDAPMSWVAPRDIADVAASILLDTSWQGRRVRAVHGPTDLSWREVASILTAELGQQVVAERITDQELYNQYLGFGLPPAVANAALGMSTGLRDDFTPEQPRTVATTTATSLPSWVHDELIAQI
ncbi:NAD(P)H-binding protein [Arthrobacter sp. 260]|uniref:NAD(P)H-binding protein n=1 Tax=Arthrobacter sp. 260 TaxID=2735314 RepID=UPI0014923627|nr:NAD(P)H-binding protein [Arthrobacter sp. 260]NOJ61328.1 NAD(P)H-binding protein [Arthrobacter sp. 260]